MLSLLRAPSRSLLPQLVAKIPARSVVAAAPRRWASSSLRRNAAAAAEPSANQGPTRAQREQFQQAARDRHAQAAQALYAQRNRSLLLYTSATIILVTGLSYAAVPLYRVFCSATGFAGTPQTDNTKFGADRLIPIPQSERRIKVQFNADSSDNLPWSFSPQQKEVNVLPGETALAFYTATNNSDEDIIGIATYNVTPNQVSPIPRMRALDFLTGQILIPSAAILVFETNLDCSLLCQSRMLLL